MKATEEVYGAQAPMLSEPLQNLGMEALAQHDLISAERFFNRVIELNLKTYGENSAGVSNSLRMVAGLYFSQNDFAKAELILLRAVKLDEQMYGHECSLAESNLATCC